MGVHPNTVRLYEELGLIPKPRRKANGYRVFTDFHIAVFKLAQTAFQIEVLQNGLRKKMVNMVKTAALGDFDGALALTQEYMLQLQIEKENAQEAIRIAQQILAGDTATDTLALRRKQAAQHLQISMDALRNWEMNGLLTVKRRVNGYRVYTRADIDRLKIIRSLRCANYSLEAILRMLTALSANPNASIEKALDTPKPDEDIISVCDKLLTSLNTAETNSKKMQQMLGEIKSNFKPSTLPPMF